MEYCNISLAMIVFNEESIIDSCLKQATSKYNFSEIVILDGGSIDGTIRIVKKYTSKVFQNIFGGHFGNQRNELIKITSGEWILMIDADEIIEDGFFNKIDELINRKDVDCYALKRKNFIIEEDGVLKQTTVYPDYQLRLFRRYCRWIYPVDEELVGFKNKILLDEDNMNIIHIKTIDKQQIQWAKYEDIGNDFRYDLPYEEMIDWDKKKNNG